MLSFCIDDPQLPAPACWDEGVLFLIGGRESEFHPPHHLIYHQDTAAVMRRILIAIRLESL